MTCSKCGQEVEKPDTRTLCNVCYKHEYDRQWRLNNREKRAKYQAEYGRRNRERLARYRAEYFQRGAMGEVCRDETRVTKIKNGCRLWGDCFTCPYEDCKEAS